MSGIERRGFGVHSVEPVRVLIDGESDHLIVDADLMDVIADRVDVLGLSAVSGHTYPPCLDAVLGEERRVQEEDEGKPDDEGDDRSQAEGHGPETPVPRPKATPVEPPDEVPPISWTPEHLCSRSS